ncbi:MAG: hypothetical protein Q4P17_06350 [Methanobacterium sp.]|nr:hypothetical protein [Methanobacterium sp.]
MGIDLAGKDDNPTGMCILNPDDVRDNNGIDRTHSNCEIYTQALYTNEEILENIQEVNPPSLLLMHRYLYLKDVAVWKKIVNVQSGVIFVNRN